MFCSPLSFLPIVANNAAVKSLDHGPSSLSKIVPTAVYPNSTSNKAKLQPGANAARRQPWRFGISWCQRRKRGGRQRYVYNTAVLVGHWREPQASILVQRREPRSVAATAVLAATGSRSLSFRPATAAATGRIGFGLSQLPLSVWLTWSGHWRGFWSRGPATGGSLGLSQLSWSGHRREPQASDCHGCQFLSGTAVCHRRSCLPLK